ncbi:MAG: MerR family transcriptional regulator [Caldilineales bacterium]
MRDLATLAGVSVRTLHHYDQIGLLTPTSRTAAGYQRAEPDDLLRLRQILFFRELDVPLAEITPSWTIRVRPGELENHRRLLQLQAERLAQLIRTVDKALYNLTGHNDVNRRRNCTRVFSRRNRSEAARTKTRALGIHRRLPGVAAPGAATCRAQWQAVKDQGDEATRLMAGLMNSDPADPEVQAIYARHHAWIENFYNAPAEMYAGLGQMYVGDPRCAHYDNLHARPRRLHAARCRSTPTRF